MWSDIPNNRQMRWLEDDGRVSVFRMPSNNSNGNTFDFQGRQVSCEHSGRRVVRYEHDGTISVIAESYSGMRLNTPNDVAPHPDGSYWFTDPSFGLSLYKGAADAPGGPGNPEGRLKSTAGQAVGIGTVKREMTSANVYRVDPAGRIDLVVSQKDLTGVPNGIAFSPDYKKLYVVTNGLVMSFDVDAANKLTNQRQVADFVIDAVPCRTDGIRVDVSGNLWCSSNAGRNLGYSGVTVWSPDGRPLGGSACRRRARTWRSVARSATGSHGREPVAVRGLRRHAGRGAGLADRAFRLSPSSGSQSRPAGSSGVRRGRRPRRPSCSARPVG